MKPGTRLHSAVCTTEVVVVRAPRCDVDLRCGGVPMAPVGASIDDAPVAEPQATHRQGTLIGKRYADTDVGLEVLATKGGEGSLSLGEAPLGGADTKALPSSD